MGISLNKNLLFRSLMILLLLVITIIAANHFVRNISSATDENLFSDPPSRFFLTKEITSIDTTAGRINPKEKIQPGMLILSIDDNKLTDTSRIKSYLNSKSGNLHRVVFLDPVKKNKIEAIISNEEFNTEAVSFLTSAVVVIEVFPGGVSDRAGMMVGDIIVKINGKQFPNMFVADRYLLLERTNEEIIYEVLRGNQLIKLKIIPVKFGLPFLILILNLAGLLSVFLGGFMVLKRPEQRASIYLGFGLVLVGTYVLLSAARYGLYIKPEFFSVVRNTALITSEYFGFALIAFSIYLFPLPVNKVSDKKWILWTFLILAAVLWIIQIVNVYYLSSKLISSYLDFGLILFVVFVVFIRIKYRRFWTKEYKRLNRPIGIMYMILLITQFGLPFLLFPLNLRIFVINYVFAFLFIILILSYYFVISRYNLLNLNLRIRRNIQYSMLSTGLRALSIIAIIAMLYGLSDIHIKVPNINIRGTNIEILNKPLDENRQLLYEKLIIIGSALILTLLFWKAKDIVQKSLDKRFFRNSFDYRKAATDMASILARNITLKDLASNITSELAELSFLKRLGIVIFRNETTLVAQDFHGITNRELFELISASGVKFAESIKPYKEDFSIDFLKEPLSEILKEFRFKYIQPIYSKNKLLGALIIGEKKSESSMSREDFSFLQTIAGQIAVAIDNSFLYEEITQKERMKHELDIARKIQLASLPGKVPEISGLDISGVSWPAFEVGGDFYDYLETENGDFMIIVGDVSGKGTSAALYMSKIQGIMRTLHEFRLSPRKLLIRTNHLLYSYLERGYFVSASAVNFNVERRKAQISRAGHLPLYYFSTNQNKLQKIITKGMVLGLTKDKTFERNMEEDEVAYSKGDLFVFITDGIIESKNSVMQEFGEERLIRTINNTIDMSAENIRNAIIESAKTYAGDEEQFDDMTVVVVKILN